MNHVIDTSKEPTDIYKNMEQAIIETFGQPSSVPVVSEEEIANIIYEEVCVASGDGIAKPSQYIKNAVKALASRFGQRKEA